MYAVGMLACVYHFANGLWTQGITWGLWTSAAAQRRASWISVVVGLALAVVGLERACAACGRVDVDKAIKVEDAMNAQQAEILQVARRARGRRPTTAAEISSRSKPQCARRIAATKRSEFCHGKTSVS